VSNLGVWFDGAIMVEVEVTSSAWPSAALRFFFEDSPVAMTGGKNMLLQDC